MSTSDWVLYIVFWGAVLLAVVAVLGIVFLLLFRFDDLMHGGLDAEIAREEEKNEQKSMRQDCD